MTLEASAFTVLYRQHAANVFRFACYLSGNRDEAEDIVAETFTRVWTSAVPVRAESVRSYLLTIARNVYLHERRRQTRSTALPDLLADAASLADVTLEQRDDVAAVSAGLATLKEIDRSALLMHATQDMTYQQIADALGLTLASVRIRIYRARLALAHLRPDA